MMRHRRLIVGGILAGMVALLYASTSWACIFLAGITVSPANVQPGGSLTVNGRSFGSNPVDLHLDSLTGMVLATVTPDQQGDFTQAVNIPEGLVTGPHVVVATEAAVSPDGLNDGSAQGVPARALFQVGTAPPTQATAPAGPVQVDSNVGVGTLVLLGVAVAAVGVFLGGLISLVASRRRDPEAEAVK